PALPHYRRRTVGACAWMQVVPAPAGTGRFATLSDLVSDAMKNRATCSLAAGARVLGGGGRGPEATDPLHAHPDQRQPTQPHRDPLPEDPSVGLHRIELQRGGRGEGNPPPGYPSSQSDQPCDQLTSRTPLVDAAL